MKILLTTILALNICTMPATEVVKEPVGFYTISAYSYSEGCGENYKTAGGYAPKPYYTVATSSEYTIGTKLYIEDVGKVQVQDRGDFPSSRIDLHIGHNNPTTFGLKRRKVYCYKKKVIMKFQKMKWW